MILAAVSTLAIVAPGVAATPAHAQTTADVAPFIRVEWQVMQETYRRPVIAGFVYNGSTYRIGSVRLLVEGLDGSNQVVSKTMAFTYIDVPARDQRAFEVPRPREGETFRVTIASFFLIAREPAVQSP
jgi:hypothetical protein